MIDLVGISVLLLILATGMYLVSGLRTRRLSFKRNCCDAPMGKRIRDRRRRQGSR